MTTIKHTQQVKVLLIDDDDVDAIGIKRAFVKLNITNPLLRARDGIEGLKKIRELNESSHEFIVILDLNMPLMGGIEMLQVLRNDPELTSTVVFVLTTSKQDEDKAAAYKQHIAGYIIKSDFDHGFLHVVDMLEHYWCTVKLPCTN